MKRIKNGKQPNESEAVILRALRRAGKEARKVARFHGTPIYIWRDGKVAAEKP